MGGLFVVVLGGGIQYHQQSLPVPQSESCRELQNASSES